MKNFSILSALVFMMATAAFSQSTYSDIDQMSGFGSCTTCAGAGANGTTATFWMKQGLSSPSMDGKAAQFFLGGNTRYSDAMWWKKLPISTSTASTLHHFIYDTYFYYKNAPAVQGLEFNVTQYFGGKGFTYGLTCDIRNTKTWKISVADTSSSNMTGMHWQSTGIACPAPPTYKWNHVVIEAERTSSNQIHYIAISLNGTKHYINKSTPYRTAPSSWGGITTHIQLNGNENQDDYSVWMDKYKVTLW